MTRNSVNIKDVSHFHSSVTVKGPTNATQLIPWCRWAMYWGFVVMWTRSIILASYMCVVSYIYVCGHKDGQQIS